MESNKEGLTGGGSWGQRTVADSNSSLENGNVNTRSEGVKNEGLTKSEAFDILRNSRRRAVISCLRERGETMSVKELATHVAAEEYNVSPNEISREQYKRVYTGLYQCHLERADDLGVIDFDSEKNTVSLREEVTSLDPFLDDGDRMETAHVELAVAMTVTTVVALGSLGIGPFGTLSASGLAMLPIAALLGLSLLQLYSGTVGSNARDLRPS